MVSGLHKIEVDDAIALPREVCEERGLEDMHSVESQFIKGALFAVDPLERTIIEVAPTHQFVVFVEQ